MDLSWRKWQPAPSCGTSSPDTTTSPDHLSTLGSSTGSPSSSNGENSLTSSPEHERPLQQEKRKTLTYCPRYELANDVNGDKRRAHVARVEQLLAMRSKGHRSMKVLLTQTTEEFRECCHEVMSELPAGVKPRGAKQSQREVVLEVGCSYGEMTMKLVKAYPDVPYVAVDRSREAIDSLRQRIKADNENQNRDIGSNNSRSSTSATTKSLHQNLNVFQWDMFSSRSSVSVYSKSHQSKMEQEENQNSSTTVDYWTAATTPAPCAVFLDIGGDRNALSVLEAIETLITKLGLLEVESERAHSSMDDQEDEDQGPAGVPTCLVVKSEWLSRIWVEQRDLESDDKSLFHPGSDWARDFLNLISTMPLTWQHSKMNKDKETSPT
ncbi:unnamed protein product [Amoebophrya sp. A25]|nr:unnamed protein product [Amoebophrya sp. A25]|eukprot:GSA25T00007840001.1